MAVVRTANNAMESQISFEMFVYIRVYICLFHCDNGGIEFHRRCLARFALAWSLQMGSDSHRPQKAQILSSFFWRKTKELSVVVRQRAVPAWNIYAQKTTRTLIKLSGWCIRWSVAHDARASEMRFWSLYPYAQVFAFFAGSIVYAGRLCVTFRLKMRRMRSEHYIYWILPNLQSTMFEWCIVWKNASFRCGIKT